MHESRAKGRKTWSHNWDGQFLFSKIKRKGREGGFTPVLLASIRREIGLYSSGPVLKLCRAKKLRIRRSTTASAFHPEIPPLKSDPSEIWAALHRVNYPPIGPIDSMPPFSHPTTSSDGSFHSCFEFSNNLHMNDSH